MPHKPDELLLSHYGNLYYQYGAPEWAARNKRTGAAIVPSIPFIGRDYLSASTKIAIYASAENLIYYEKSLSDNELLETEFAWNRHRTAFEWWLKSAQRGFFPKVHIAPVENGGLICAALFLCKRLGLEWNSHPHELLEKLVVANVGKYSITTAGMKQKRNIDYAGDFNKLEFSTPFFKAELEILKPNVLVLPRRIYSHSQIKQLISEVIPSARVIGVLQCNARNLNFHLRSVKEQAIKLKDELENSFPSLVDWTNQICDANLKQGFYRYYVHLVSVLNS